MESPKNIQVTCKKGLLKQDHLSNSQQVKCRDTKVCNQKRVYSQGSQVRRWENQSQIPPPHKGQCLEILVG